MPHGVSIMTPEILKSLLDYNPATGVFTWKVRRNWKATAGQVAGNIRPDGYVLIKLLGKNYYAHRLAYMYEHGRFPEQEIDHRDGNKQNNSISNLRDCSASINMQNLRGHRKGSIVPELGVSKHGSRFRARVRVKGTQLCLGLYDTAEEASRVYAAFKEAAQQEQQ